MQEKVKNFVENIHSTAYDKVYYETLLTSDGMVYDAGRKKEKLSGHWNFCIDIYDSCLRAKWFLEETKDSDGRDVPIDFDFDGWDEIIVPSSWNVQKREYFYYEGPAVYSRKFKYKNHGEKTVFIKFGAVNYEAKVFVNKQFVGMHKGGSTPFYIDVTKYLQEENRIIVVATNQRKHEQVPNENTDWFNYGGIHRDVELIRLPKNYIKYFKMGLAKGGANEYKEIALEVTLNQAIDAAAVLEIPELEVKAEVKINGGFGKAIILSENIALWDTENPKLYDVTLSCGGDCINEKIGFRIIDVRGNDVLLNGKSIYLNGVSLHEESAKNGRSLTDDEIIENIRIAKEMGCNFMRLAHYPHSERAAQLADELGMMLWEEIPVYWAIDFDNPVTVADARNQLSELIKRDVNRASVIIWSVGNENPDTDSRLKFMGGLTSLAKELDSTRLVSAACLVDHTNLKISDRLEEYLDVVAFNEYYGWYEPNFDNLLKIVKNSSPEKPIIISEFGGDGAEKHYGSVDELGTEDKQRKIYEMQIEVFQKTPYIKGTSPWILYDFRCPRRHAAHQNEYNIKGLLNKDKTHKKLAFYTMRDFYGNRNI